MAADDFVSDLDFEEACEHISALGLPFPSTPASQRIVGSGGDRCRSLHGVSLEEVFEAVQAVQDLKDAFGTETTTLTASGHGDIEAPGVASGSKGNTTEEPCSSQHPSTGENPASCSGRQGAGTQIVSDEANEAPTPAVGTPIPSSTLPLASNAGSGRLRRTSGRARKSKKANRVASYFEEIPSQNPSRQGKFDSVCLQCDYVVSSIETRYQLFHVILCSSIPFSVRLGIYFTSNDKMKPPLIEAPPRHCEPHQARIIVRQQTKSLQELIEGYLSRRDDLSRDQALARWMLAQAEIKVNRRIDECTPEESRVMSGLVMDFIVEENIPFAVCGNRDGVPRPLGRILNYARPGYKMPAASKVAGDMLTKYYTVVKNEIQHRLQNMIPNQCRVTIMFDRSEDVKNQPLINVLMRVMGGSGGSVKTYFIKSVYTGYDTCDATYYVKMVEEAVQEFGGFDSISGVVTDNTASVMKARDILEQKYCRLVASQDQAHVADLLMADIGQIPWIRETLESVASIGTYLRRFRKLRAKVVEMMENHNVEVRKIRAALSQGNHQRNVPGETRTEDESRRRDSDDFEEGNVSRDDLHNPDKDDVDDEDSEDDAADIGDDGISVEDAYSSADESGHRKAPRLVTISNVLSSQIPAVIREIARSHEEDEDIVSPTADQLTLNREAATNSCAGDVPRFASIMKKVSAVRFASLEKLLHEYKSLRKLLLELVSNRDFESLCSFRTSKERLQLEQKFTLPIKDEQLFQRVVQVHAIMKACRLYLRMFDSESCLISEVVRATDMLEQTLRDLPSHCFPEPYEDHQKELLEVFRNRREGPFPGRKQVKVTLISDLHVAAALLDPYRCPFDISPHKQALRDHLEKYLCGSDAFRNELDKDEFIVEMMNQYDIAHSLWKEKGYLRADSERTSAAERREAQGLSSLRRLRERSPISWWNAGSLKLPRDGYAKRAAKALVEFAIRTLSVSPTATATERTFSHLSRIQPKQRSGLSIEKVEKILFCQWNLRVLRKVANAYELDVQSEAKKQNTAINQLRAHRKHVTTMSFLGSLRSNRVAIEPSRPVTAENEPQQPAEATPMRLTIEEDNERPTTRLRHQGNTIPTPLGQPAAFQQQIVRASSPRAGAFRASPYDVLQASGECGTSVVPLKDVVRAAVDVGYAIRRREGRKNDEAPFENIREPQTARLLQYNTAVAHHTDNRQHGAQGRGVGDSEIEGRNIREDVGTKRMLDDQDKVEQENVQRQRVD